MSNFFRFLSLKRRPAAEPVVSQTARLTPSPTASTLLKDVLGGESPSHHAAQSSAKKAAASPLSQRLGVGARLADTKIKIMEAASKLTELADAETAQVIKTLIEGFERRVCTIAFAGQVKAGKSSLINVLVEQPDLLPSDINPWTTVITKLHFGVPGKPQSGASFTFFNRDEWQLLSIGGRTRELTERLFPDFDWKTLRSHVEEMQEKARRKLGPRFEDLLGTEHAYPEITPGLLNRYVGAGHPDAESSPEGAEGEYSDITKVANVFLDLGAFSFPTILIDTPGVNDPFLVRDEITRQNLEAADICVIVLTARQPLSTADLGLLRMLRGLKKDRLILFINKIDEISGGEDVLREVSQRVTAILKKEFPAAHIPIVFGCAIWARKALSSSAFGRHKPAVPGENTDEGAKAPDWPSHEEIIDTVTAETFFLKSGLSSLAVAISEMMRAGPIADAVGATATLLGTVCRNLIFWLETEIAILGKVPASLETAKSELSAIVALRAALAAEFDAFSGRLAAIYAEKVSGLHQSLAQALQDAMPDMLAALPDEAIATQASQIDAKLRIKLESVFLAAVEDAGSLIVGEQQRLGTELTKLLESSSLEAKPAIIVGQPLAASPSLAALSEPAALGLAASFREFSAGVMPPEDQGAYLSRIILADFEPIIEKLAREAARVFRESSMNLIHQVRVLTLSPMDVAIHRISAQIHEAEAPQTDGASIPHSVERNIQSLRETVSNLNHILAAGQPAVPVQHSVNRMQ